MKISTDFILFAFGCFDSFGAKGETKMASEKTKKLVYAAALMSFFAFSLAFSEESKNTLFASLEMCARILVPSLFPFAVFGHLIGSAVAEFPLVMTVTVSRIFGVSRKGAKALLPGLFAGFPVGCTGACGLYLRSEISERDFCRICALSLTPGAAFVISGVGGGMFGSRRIGIIIYFSVMISVFAVGFFTRGKCKEESKSEDRFDSLPSRGFAEVLAEAVSKSGTSMLVMSAFVVFFSQISLFLTMACKNLPNSELWSAVFKGVIEVSGASEAASKLGGAKGIVLAVFACAWSGLSVQMQTLAICAQNRSKKLMSTMIFLRAAISVLACAISAAALQIFALY